MNTEYSSSVIFEKYRYVPNKDNKMGTQMLETTFEVRVPVPLIRMGFDQNEIQRRLLEWLVLSLFTEGRISSGKAARFLNISRIEFLALLRTRGIAYINYTPDELEEELAAVEEMEIDVNT